MRSRKVRRDAARWAAQSSAARSAVVEERLLGRSQVRPRGVGGIRVAIITGAMVVAGSARTADRIRWRLDIAAETCFPTAVHPGWTEEAQRQLAEQPGGAPGSYNFMGSRAAAHTSRRDSFLW
jgi:hypothetical protein